MKIGLFGGSFDPPHNADISLAKTFLHDMSLDEVWLMVTPENPWKRGRHLTADAHRLEMVRCAIANSKGLVASDYEFHLPKPTYSYLTLRNLRSDFPHHEFTLLIGGDNWEEFNHWAEYREILTHHAIAVYPRPGHTVHTPSDVSKFLGSLDSGQKLPTILTAQVYDISSTTIRCRRSLGEDITSFVSHSVAEYISRHGLYTSFEE